MLECDKIEPINYQTELLMAMGEFGWIVGLHVVMSVWLGLLAAAWKGRSTPMWIAVGLCLSWLGLLWLACLPRVQRRAEADMQMQHMDGTSLLN